jgi:hypothetical protein
LKVASSTLPWFELLFILLELRYAAVKPGDRFFNGLIVQSWNSEILYSNLSGS